MALHSAPPDALPAPSAANAANAGRHGAPGQPPLPAPPTPPTPPTPRPERTPGSAPANSPGRSRAWAWRAWPRETRDTLFQLVVIASTIAPHLLHLPGWCTALTAVVLAWRAAIALRGGALPGRWPVIAVLAVAVTLTLLTERTLLGKEAGVTMLVVLMALKTLELRARRDTVVVFFLGFFLVLTQCLYSQSLLTALAMLLATWGLLTALVLGNLPVGKPPLWRAAAVAARSTLFGLPLMVALFVLFPRFGPLWSLPSDSAGRTGLSGTLRLGGVAELANDDSIAMRVRFTGAGAPAPHELYFRGLVLSRFDGLDWQQSLLSVSRPMGRTPDLQVQGPPLAYEVLLEAIRLPLLPLLEATPADPADAPGLPDWGLWLGADLQWHTDRPVGERLSLQARAYTRFSHGLDATSGELDAMTRLPPGFNPRTLAWARQVQAQLGAVDARTLAAAMLAHVRHNAYVYTLAPGHYGRDAVDEFWLDRREGFCEHFASSFVVVMRAMGVPARVVVGYQGAEQPDDDGWRTVRQSHAHAWAEYWQADSGWQRADPTAAVAPERVRAGRALPPRPGLVAGALQTMNPALAERLRRGWERLDTRWTQWVMGWSRSQQFDLLQRLGVQQPDWTDLARALIGLLALAAAAAALWAWRDRLRQDPWQSWQARLVDRLQRSGVPAQRHHAPRTLAALVRAHQGASGNASGNASPDPAAQARAEAAATALADALDALDRQRYGPHAASAKRPSAREVWAPLVRLAQGLRPTGSAPRVPLVTPRP